MLSNLWDSAWCREEAPRTAVSKQRSPLIFCGSPFQKKEVVEAFECFFFFKYCFDLIFIALFILATENPSDSIFPFLPTHWWMKLRSKILDVSTGHPRPHLASLKGALTPCSLSAWCLLGSQAVFTFHRTKMRFYS